MSTDAGEPRPEKHRDAGHLDEDAEALEDPVHAGDARHQQEQHEKRQEHDEDHEHEH